MSDPTHVDRRPVGDDEPDDEPDPQPDGGHTVPVNQTPTTAQQMQTLDDVGNWARENPWTAAAAAGLLYAGYQFVSPNSVEVGEVGGGSGADDGASDDRTLRAAVGESGQQAVERARELVETNGWDSGDFTRLHGALSSEGVVEDSGETSDVWDRLKSDGVIA